MLKKIIISVVTLVLFFVVMKPAEAQMPTHNPELTITITTEVVETIELFTLNNINLGAVQPEQRLINVDPITNANAGSMLATGNPNSTIRISYVDMMELRSVDGNGIIRFYYRVSGSSQNDQATSAYLEPQSLDLSFNESGEYYFWIGGHAVIVGEVRGRYEGDFTFEVEYN